MKKKKVYLLILSVCGIALSVIGVTYAFWQFRAFQTDENRIASSCFQVTFKDDNKAISLQKAFPISDEEGQKLIPYEFTITNICSTSLTYIVNLETLNLEEGQKNLPEEYIKVQFDNRTPLFLKDYENVDTTLENATSSHRLTTGILDENTKSVSYSLRLWLEESTPATEEVMNAYFKSKITVIATYRDNEQLKNNITILAQSNTDEFNESGENITLIATSENYPLTEYKISQMKETQNWKPIKEKNTTFTITEEFHKIGKYYFSVKDEAGNIKEQEFEVTKIDTSGPNISYTETNNLQSVELSITMKDTQSGLVKYQITKEDLTPITLLKESTPNPPNSWIEISNTKEDFVIKKNITDNGIYYIFAQDDLGHISSVKYSTDIIDKTPPTINLKNDLNSWGEHDKIHISLSDDKVGLFGYQIKTEDELPSEWQTIDENLKEITIDYEVEENGTYFVYAKDVYNNVSQSSIEITNIDNQSPEIDLSNDLKNWGINDSIHIKLNDSDSGLTGYQIMTEEKDPTEWNVIENNAKSFNTDYSVTKNNTYYIYAKDALNHISHQRIQILHIDDHPPVAKLTLSFKENTKEIIVIANASESVDNETSIASYEYNINDGDEWIKGESIQELKGKCSNKVTVRIKDNAGNVAEATTTLKKSNCVDEGTDPFL